MHTQYESPEEFSNALLQIVDHTRCINEVRPLSFIEKMKHNRGVARTVSLFGETEDGMEAGNPLIVALGDSVTAGHFESLYDLDTIVQWMEQRTLAYEKPVEVTDARVCYLEQFRLMLIDKYEYTSVSAINAGIAGDTISGMQKRLYRDVIRHQPDLLLINASLNWDLSCGNTADYARVFRQVIRTLKNEIIGDIVLMTPNMDRLGRFDNPLSDLHSRVEVIRDVAQEESLCMVDVFKLWEIYEAAGYPIEPLLANGLNHPSVVGHTVYARALMQLMD